MATQRKKKESTKKTANNTSNAKKRLIVSYEKLSDKDKDLFEEKYEDGFMDHIQTVTRPDGTPMFVVPLETEENIYMVKIDLRVDTKMSEEDFEKEILHETKDEQDDISKMVNGEDGKSNKEFRLNHGDYSMESLEEAVAREDMDAADFTSLDDIDVADDNSMDL
ncbi:MAG: hypothetical protein IJ681_01565 [Bacteroidales bacterium]|nr:hypothetical protein [Bacteroidales bacterium]